LAAKTGASASILENEGRFAEAIDSDSVFARDPSLQRPGFAKTLRRAIFRRVSGEKCELMAQRWKRRAEKTLGRS
jgi:hypothetical protein